MRRFLRNDKSEDKFADKSEYNVAINKHNKTTMFVTLEASLRTTMQRFLRNDNSEDKFATNKHNKTTMFVTLEASLRTFMQRFLRNDKSEYNFATIGVIEPQCLSRWKRI